MSQLRIYKIAVSKFFDGEGPDLVAEALANESNTPAPQRVGQRGVLIDEMEYLIPTSSQRDAAPRIVPQPTNKGVWKPPLPFALLLLPFNLLWKLVLGSFSMLGWLFPFLPRLIHSLSNRSGGRAARAVTGGRRPLNPKDNAARFIREFGEEYGEHRLPFLENGYAQAYDLAKKDLKFLLVVLLSPEHDDTETFVRETLLSQEVESFVNNPENNVVLWAGNVQDSEAYQLAGGLSCTKFPFAALIVHTPQESTTAMSTVARVVGLTSPSEFVSKLRSAINQHSPPLERTRAQRREQEATRNLRQQQETAYERSLAQDRERMRLRKEAEATKQMEEQEAQAKAKQVETVAQQLQEWKKWRASTISVEPDLDVKNVTRLSIRMPSGDRIVRRFVPEATIEDVYAFVECYDILENDTTATEPPAGYTHDYKFKLVSPMPRAIYDVEADGTIADRIGRSGNLIVEPVEVADEDA